MLAPETRALLTDALRPPDGYRVDLAVATTYSLDLTALLLAPMSFALHETANNELDAVDGVALLESLRRYAQRTTVFCQAGAIHLPAKYSPLLQFLEQSVCEVSPPDQHRIFHPKIWMIRFVAADSCYLHRVLVLSRNLTFDRCWDTLVRLDERETGSSATAPDTKPLITFLRALPDLATSLDPARRDQVGELCDSLADASFEIPDGFSTLEFLPFGLDATAWPFPQTADRALLISPFLDVSAATRATNLAREVRILSRPESFDRVGVNALAPTAELWTLQRPAEIEVGADSPSAERASHEGSTVRDGLHAKTFVLDTGSTSSVLTGSANLTSAAFGGNVEFAVLLTGPTATCGVASIWDGSTESPGLSHLAERYEPKAMSEDDAARANLELEVDRFHTELAIRGAQLDVSTAGEDLVDLVLNIVSVDSPGTTHVWPISLPRIRGRVLGAQAQLSWQAIDRRNITPFVAVETVAGSGSTEVSSRMVIKAVLTGDVGDRRAIAMSEILRSPADVLRYLALLLADPSLDPSAIGEGSTDAGHDWERRAGMYDLVVLEPLMRASLRDDDALKRVANLMQELRAMGSGSMLLPDGFGEIWDAVWEARGERR